MIGTRSADELEALVDEQARQLDLSRRQQTATAEVLHLISQSPADLERVLTIVLQKAAELCAAGPAQIFRRDGDIYRYAVSRILDPVYRAIEEQVRIAPGRDTLVGRVALEAQAVHIDDAWADPDYGPRDEVRLGNVRSMLGVPLLRGNELVGIMVLGRSEVLPFSPAEIALVTTFADQAVIAIENARLFQEARKHAADLERSLDDLRQTQDRLVQTEKLAALGQLVAGVAHEINTPIGNAITVASTLEGELHRLVEMVVATSGDGRPGHVETLRRLEGGAALVSANLQRAAGLVQNFRRIASAQGSGERGRFPARTWLDRLVRGLPMLRHRLVVDCPPSLEIEGHPDLLAQVVESLVRNCDVHAFADGVTGTIAIRVCLADTEDVMITVADDGRGIASEHVKRIFDPFFTTARGKGSLGLGLHIAHSAVAAMRGRLDVRSSLGEGTCFTLTLPNA